MGLSCDRPSLVPQIYLTAVEKNPQLRDKIWAEAWGRGYDRPILVTQLHDCFKHSLLALYMVAGPNYQKKIHN